MPVTIGTLGTGGLGSNAVKPLRMVTPNATSASRWLEAAGYAFPNQDFLRGFLERHSGQYGFLDYGRFFTDLSNAVYRAPIVYYDPYANWRRTQYSVVRSAPLQFLLENLRMDVALPIAANTVTPEDLFALSAIWGAEIALTLRAGSRHVFSQGRPGAVRSPDGHMVLAHTHPTKSQDKTQVAGDIEVAGIGRAEIVITEDMIIYITRNEIINVVRGDRLYPLDGMYIDRTTRLNPQLFNDLHRQYLAIEQLRDEAEARANEQLRLRLKANPSSSSDSSWMDFLEPP